MRRAAMALAAMSALGGAEQAGPPAAASPPDVVVEGVLTRADHRGFREHTFDVPPGVERMSMRVVYARGRPLTAIDLTLYGPEGYRGAGGFWRNEADIGPGHASPGFLAGSVQPGRWTVTLGGATVPEGARTPYAIEVRYALRRRTEPPTGFEGGPKRSGPGWYRGDFHTHTGQSDGRCRSRGGKRVGCPAFRTLEAAAERGLDFVAVTDHNTVAHFAELRALQPYFDDLLIIPGQEVTTYRGHVNVLGPTRRVEHRLGSSALPDFDALTAEVEAAGGLLSINHPGIPEPGGCAGCGWSADVRDYGRVQAVEVANGVLARYDGLEGRSDSLPFWRARLNAGARLTAVGGSDNHDPDLAQTLPSAVGTPTTVVHAAGLGVAEILAGVRAGRVFVDVEGVPGRRLDLTARSGRRSAVMGQGLPVSKGAVVTFEAVLAGVPDGRLDIVQDDAVQAQSPPGAPLTGDEEVRSFKRTSDGRPGWVRIDVRAADGRLLLIGNPIYLEPEA